MTIVFRDNVQTCETQKIEELFRSAGFADPSAYRHNSVSIRLRVRDPRFQGMTRVARMKLLEPIIEQLPDETQQDLIFVLPIAPGEEHSIDYLLMNLEFDQPRPSSL